MKSGWRWVVAGCLVPAALAVAQEPAETDNPLAREDWFYQQRALPGTRIVPGARLRALNELRRMNPAAARIAGLSPSQWTSIGPTPIGTGTDPFAGRVTSIAVDPRNKDVVYAGFSEGGVWKTLNGGTLWTPLMDGAVSMAIGSLALDPKNPDTLYVGTGEANNSADSYYGAGILKTTDGGSTWSQITGPFVTTSGGAHIGALAVSPGQSNILLAGIANGSQTGIWRSGDAGLTWSRVLSGATGCDLAFDPGNPNIVWAALGSTSVSVASGVYKSTDAGLTWTPQSGSGANTLPTANVGRIALAVAPSNPQSVLASIAETSSGNLLGLYQTNDGGTTWTNLRSAPPFCSNICWYANVVRYNPANANIIYAGGGALGMWGSSDGGATWRSIDNSLHVDHHALAFAADGSRLYDGNDGGIWSTEDITSLPSKWKNLNATVTTALFNPGFSISAGNANLAYAGTQDNNTLRFSGSPAWISVACGDGGWTVLDPALPDQPYTTCQHVSLLKGPTGGSGLWLQVTHGIDLSDAALFYPPMTIDPTDGLRLYYGTNRLYQTLDGGGLWAPLTGTNAGNISTIAVSPSNPDRVWFGLTNGQVWLLSAAISGSGSVARRDTGLPNRYVTQIAADPGNADIVYVTYSGFTTLPATGQHVFVTQNAGLAWRDISLTLPNVPVNDLAIDPDIAGALYVATDIGVFYSADSGNTWTPLGTGFPNVVVQAIRLHRKARILRAATHGRGMWDLSVPLPTGALTAPAISQLNPTLFNAGSGNQSLEIDGARFSSNSVVWWNGAPLSTAFVDPTKLFATVPATNLTTPGRAYVIVANPAGEGGLSAPASLAIGPAPLITAKGIVSSATGTAGAFAPGSIVTIYGSNLASGVEQAVNANLPSTLANVSVKIGSLAAPLFYVSPGQMNVQLPWFLPGSIAAVQYTTGDLTGPPTTINLTTYAPSLFSTNSQGTGQGSILIANTGLLAAPVNVFPGSKPVQRGGYIEIYCTGLGPVSPAQTNGVPAPTSPLARAIIPTVTIDNQPAQVTFSGLTPGTVGLYQVDVQVPASVQPGDAVPVQLAIGAAVSNVVTIAVQ